MSQPLPSDKNTQVEFVDETVGTNVPKVYVPGIKKGFLEYCEKGPLSGYRLSGIRFRLIDGMHHIVDSSEYSFFLAAQGAMKDAFDLGVWQLLEPIMTVEIVGPVEFQVR